jgi:signal transduction histidine kinase
MASTAIALDAPGRSYRAVVSSVPPGREDNESPKSSSSAMLAFIGRLSHELRAPLTAILGYVDLLDMEVHGPVTARQRADLDCIREGEAQLLLMINDLLDYLKVQSGQLSYRAQDVPIGKLVAGALRLMEPMISAKGLTSDCVPGTDLTVCADRDRIRQILLNLVTNAIKFTPSGGTIRVECDVTADTVHVRVGDTGRGIPADRLDAIFEPFVQVAEGPADSRQGVGLGLAISRDLARAMCGELTVESEVGVGSQFTLSLPRGGVRSDDRIASTSTLRRCRA